VDEPTPVELACLHLRGNEDEDYPECRRCHALMEREPDEDPAAFCASCIYEVTDVLAREVVRLDDSPPLFAAQAKAAALQRKIDEGADARMLLTFISEMAMTVSQTAVGPLNEAQRHMIWEIKAAARGTVPDWFLEDWKERSKEK
jgi:hypothetical protein